MGTSESRLFPPSCPLSHIFIFIREAWIILKPGKNQDGLFDANNLLAQVDHMIDLFKGRTNSNAQGLFLFDNAPSHQKWVLDALSARNMVKGVPFLHVPDVH